MANPQGINQCGVPQPLPDRLREKLILPRLPNTAIDFEACHLWRGAHSQSGRRGVFYPVISWGRKCRRVNRLVLILQYGPADLPAVPGEAFDTWLARALAYYAGWEASHTCDNALCVNFTHLEWKGHAENIASQVARRRAAFAVSAP